MWSQPCPVGRPRDARGRSGQLGHRAVRNALIAVHAAISQAKLEVAKAARRYGLSAFWRRGLASIC
jgi:hypothetical protein